MPTTAKSDDTPKPHQPAGPHLVEHFNDPADGRSHIEHLNGETIPPAKSRRAPKAKSNDAT